MKTAWVSTGTDKLNNWRRMENLETASDISAIFARGGGVAQVGKGRTI